MSTRGHHGLLLLQATGAAGVIEVLTQAFTSSTNHNVNMPASVSAGAILIVAVANGGNTASSMVTTPSGWTTLGTTRDGTNACRLTLFYITAVGTEGGTSVNFATAGGAQLASTLWHFPPGTASGTPEAAVSVTATSTTPTPPAITPSWGALAGTNGIVMAAFGLNTATVTAYPYPTQNKSIMAGTNPYSALASCITTFGGATLTPGAFTISVSVPHVRATIALKA